MDDVITKMAKLDLEKLDNTDEENADILEEDTDSAFD